MIQFGLDISVPREVIVLPARQVQTCTASLSAHLSQSPPPPPPPSIGRYCTYCMKVLHVYPTKLKTLFPPFPRSRFRPFPHSSHLTTILLRHQDCLNWYSFAKQQCRVTIQGNSIPWITNTNKSPSALLPKYFSTSLTEEKAAQPVMIDRKSK